MGQGLSKTDKENRVAFAQLYKQKLVENPNFLQRIVLWRVQFLVARCFEQEKLLDLGFQRPGTVQGSP